MWQKSPLVVDNVDYDKLNKYLGMNVSNEVLKNEKLLDLVYRKRKENYKKKKLKKKVTLKMKNKMKNTNQIKSPKMKNKNRKTEKKKKKETFDENWMKPKKKPNIFEKIRMFSVALERLILVSTKNHIYSFKGVNRVQKSGMPTGLSETGYLADLFMLWWDKKFIKLLESVCLSCDLFVRFKDDGNIIMDKITSVPEGV